MNYLGHLFLSNDNPTIMLGNLLGDFVKGNRFENIPVELHEGIYLHRQIDFFIDHHPLVNELQMAINEQLPKVSGISIDLIFDYLLANNWNQFKPENLQSFLDKFYDYSAAYQKPLPERFEQLLERLRTHNFIFDYQQLEYLDKVSDFLSEKLSFPNELKATRKVFEENRNLFENAFFLFLNDAVEKFSIEIEKK